MVFTDGNAKACRKESAMPFDSLFRSTEFDYTASDYRAQRTGSSGTFYSAKVIQPTIGRKIYLEFLEDGTNDYTLVGIESDDWDGYQHCGFYSTGYAVFSNNGYKFNNNSSSSYGVAWTVGDIIMIAFDAITGKIWFGKNGVWFNSGNPATGVNPAFSGIPVDTVDFLLWFSGRYDYCASVVADKASAFTYDVPIGFVPLVEDPPPVYVFFPTDQIIRSKFSFYQDQLVGMSNRVYYNEQQVILQAHKVYLTVLQSFDTTTPIYMQQEQVFNNLVQIALMTTQIMRCYGAPVVLEMLQTWAAYDYNLVYLPMVQVIGSQLDTVLQDMQFSVTVASSRVGIVDFDFDRKGFCNVATLLLRKRSEWINKEVGDQVVLTILGEQYEMIVINKPQDEQVSQGGYEVGYLLECASGTCQLAEGLNPDISASRVTVAFPSGTLLTAILDFLTAGVCSYTLDGPDFPVGEYNFEDAERFAALREVLPEQYGWVINTDGANVLQIGQWALPDIGGPGQKTLTMRRKSLTPPADKLYTDVTIKNYNQQDGASGLQLEVVDNGDGTGKIFGYSVPWTAAFSIFDSEDATAPSLLIDGGTVEDVEIEDTDVEFVGYAASLSKPCYSDPVVDWGNNDSLSPVTSTESGALSTVIDPGYSVAGQVTYTTRRKIWSYDNRKIDVSQVRLKYDKSD